MQFLRLFLAVFRLTVLFVKDDQPIIKWFRDDWAVFRPFIRSVLACHRCFGVWAAGLVWVLDRLKWTRWIVDVLALAGLEVIVYDAWTGFNEWKRMQSFLSGQKED